MTSQAPPSNLLSTDRAASLRLALAMAEEAQRVGRRIRQLRDQRRWTQAELASELPGRVQGSDISRWERGKHLPNASMREALADALGVDVGDLYREQKNGTGDLMGALSSAQSADAEIQAKILHLLAELGRAVDGLVTDVQELKQRLPGSSEGSGGP